MLGPSLSDDGMEIRIDRFGGIPLKTITDMTKMAILIGSLLNSRTITRRHSHLFACLPISLLKNK